MDIKDNEIRNCPMEWSLITLDTPTTYTYKSVNIKNAIIVQFILYYIKMSV